jgi:A/G-specific adenine glycosylase
MASGKDIAAFRRTVWAHYRKEGRHDLPWRKTADPYRILVSEMMLQQTQVQRVIPKYEEFIERYPTVRSLAKAPLSEVLAAWSGLGYNRRAKYLHDAANMVVADHRGNMKEALQERLPGVGPYTRAAVRAFAFNEPHTMIETNIRTVLIHHFYAGVLQKTVINDKDIRALAERAGKGQDPREWHWALMDYGAHLKASGIRNNAQSAHYTKQSRFKGSLREVRGAILKAMHAGKKPRSLPFAKTRIKAALASLKKDGLI